MTSTNWYVGSTSGCRMKAEKELGLPITRRTGAVISVPDGQRANKKLDDAAWGAVYQRLSGQLERDYPDLYHRVFGEVGGDDE